MTATEGATTGITTWMVSSDSHIVEPPDLWDGRLPADLADRGPQIVREEDGDWWYIDGYKTMSFLGTQTGVRFDKDPDKLATSANFDEDVFDDPFTLDIRRQPNDHLTFGGGGEHFCLGANLARAEIKAMVREFITRCPDVALAGEPLRMRSDFINGINHMPMRFTPSRPVGSAA